MENFFMKSTLNKHIDIIKDGDLKWVLWFIFHLSLLPTIQLIFFYFKYIYTGWPVQLYTVLPQGEYTKMHAHIVYNQKHVNILKSLGI